MREKKHGYIWRSPLSFCLAFAIGRDVETNTHNTHLVCTAWRGPGQVNENNVPLSICLVDIYVYEDGKVENTTQRASFVWV